MEATNKKLIQLVLDKTKAKLLSWTRGSSVNEYKAELNAATLYIAYNYNDNSNSFVPLEELSMYMYNGTGAPISLAHELSNNLDYGLLYELYLVAKDSSTKESETICELFNELNTL